MSSAIIFVVEQAPEGGFTSRAIHSRLALAAILADVAQHLELERDELLRRLLG